MNIKEKWNEYKAWKKAKIEELHEKHPKVADALAKTQAVVAIGLIFGATYAVGYSDGQKKLINDTVAETNRRKEQMNKEPILAPWKEEYKENYEKATEFGRSLNMAEGEQIVISDSSVYNSNMKPIWKVLCIDLAIVAMKRCIAQSRKIMEKNMNDSFEYIKKVK